MTSKDLKVNVKVLKGPKILGIATVYNPPWAYHGYLILKSKYLNKRGELLWVKPPSHEGADGKFHEVIFLEDKDLWHKLEETILDEYQKEKKTLELEGKSQLTDEDYKKIDEAIQE